MRLGKEFKPNLSEFPVDLSSLQLPAGWQEEKWSHVIHIRNKDDSIISIPLAELIRSFTYGNGQLAGIESINEANGRQLVFAINPESREGNEFTGWLYRERNGGGTTIVAYAIMKNGKKYIALLAQNRPLLFQDGEVLQVIGGYPVKMSGTAKEVRAATFKEEINELGKFEIDPDEILEIGSPYNTNKAMVLTGPAEGISVQLVRIPAEVLEELSNGTVRLNKSLIDIDTDRILEGISKETFYELNHYLVRQVTRPSSGASSCAHTELAVRRAFDVLIRGEVF